MNTEQAKLSAVRDQAWAGLRELQHMFNSILTYEWPHQMRLSEWNACKAAICCVLADLECPPDELGKETKP